MWNYKREINKKFWDVCFRKNEMSNILKSVEIKCNTEKNTKELYDNGKNNQLYNDIVTKRIKSIH